MKKLIFSLLVVLSFTATSIAQVAGIGLKEV